VALVLFFGFCCLEVVDGSTLVIGGRGAVVFGGRPVRSDVADSRGCCIVVQIGSVSMHLGGSSMPLRGGGVCASGPGPRLGGTFLGDDDVFGGDRLARRQFG
jgi:hypothetical protein